MNLLVTGGAGFIGSNLIRFLIGRPEIWKLVNLDCLTYAGHLENLAGIEEDPRYFFEKADLRDGDSVARVVRDHSISHVMHLAAESHVDRSITGPGDFIQTNIVGTFNLLEACRHEWQSTLASAPLQHRFLHVSTDEVYGSLGAEGQFTESSCYAPNSPYSASKAASDLLVRASHRTYGLPTLITHCSNNYGPYQHPEKMIPVIIQNLLARRPVPIYGDGLNVRDWLHVSDHCRALWKILLQGTCGESYCIGGAGERTNLELAHGLCGIMDELVPALGGQSRDLLTLVKDRPGHDRRYAINHGKLTRETGWKPAYDLDNGLRKTVEWYLAHQDWVQAVASKIL